MPIVHLVELVLTSDPHTAECLGTGMGMITWIRAGRPPRHTGGGGRAGDRQRGSRAGLSAADRAARGRDGQSGCGRGFRNQLDMSLTHDAVALLDTGGWGARQSGALRAARGVGGRRARQTACDARRRLTGRRSVQAGEQKAFVRIAAFARPLPARQAIARSAPGVIASCRSDHTGNPRRHDRVHAEAEVRLVGP